MVGAGLHPRSGVSPFGTPPRVNEEEESPGSESDASPEAQAVSGSGAATGGGRSVGFSSVSVSSDFDPLRDEVSGAQVKRMRFQLRTVHGSLKGKIQEENRIRQEQIPKLTEVVGNRTHKLDVRLRPMAECMETFKVTRDQLHALNVHNVEPLDKVRELRETCPCSRRCQCRC
ncbi:hypothetical protein N9L68_07480 [bacterium]|nr:hypothetical protein [bacterium]